MIARSRKGRATALLAGAACLGVLALAWTRRDDVRAMLSPDFAARREAIRLVEGRRTPEDRERFRIVIPEGAADVPDSFEVRLYGRCLDICLLSIDLIADHGRARGEMASKEGLFEGEVPSRVLDAFVRKVHYLDSMRDEKVDRCSDERGTATLYAAPDSIDPHYPLESFVHAWCLSIRGRTHHGPPCHR